MIGRLISRLFAVSEPDDETNPFEALGHHRKGIIWVLGFEMRDDPMILTPPGPEDDVFAAYRQYAERAMLQMDPIDDSLPVAWWIHAMIGALRLTTGDLGGADAILDNLPPERVVLDHGAGRGMLVPAAAILNAFELQDKRPDWQDLIAGSLAEQQVRDWLDVHREQLVWHEFEGRYLPRTA